ncbi:hypothetical protein RKD05_001633 [Microbacterium sp. SLBN-111]
MAAPPGRTTVPKRRIIARRKGSITFLDRDAAGVL